MEETTYRLTSVDLDKAENTLGTAFLNYPYPGGTISDEKRRLECLKIMFRLEMDRIITFGTIESINSECSSIAAWCTLGDMGSGAALPTQIRKLLGHIKLHELLNGILRYLVIEKGRKNLHLSPDTMYLFSIGVLPEIQKKGHGSRLISKKLEECSGKGQTVYLETNTEHNRDFYKKFGFEIVQTIVDEKQNLTTYAMIKKP